MEKCKQSTKTSVQKSKGIRKKLPVSKNIIQKAKKKKNRAVEKILTRSEKAKKALAVDKTKDDKSAVTGKEEVLTSNGRKTRYPRSKVQEELSKVQPQRPKHTMFSIY